MVKNNVCLIVIDGWGITDKTEGKERVFSLELMTIKRISMHTII